MSLSHDDMPDQDMILDGENEIILPASNIIKSIQQQPCTLPWTEQGSMRSARASICVYIIALSVVTLENV